MELSQLIKTSKHSSRSATTIDLIFTNIDSCNTSGVLNLHISDHKPVFVMKKKMRDSRRKVAFTGHTYVRYSKDILNDALINSEKLKFREEADPNKCWDLMETFLNNFLNEWYPVRTFRSKESTPPWITHDLKVLAKDRDRAWEVAKSSNTEVDWALAKHLRNLANNAVKAAKAIYIKIELHNNRSDPKKFWMNIKDVLPNSSSSNINIVDIITKNVLSKKQQGQEINNSFRNYWSKTG